MNWETWEQSKQELAEEAARRQLEWRAERRHTTRRLGELAHGHVAHELGKGAPWTWPAPAPAPVPDVRRLLIERGDVARQVHEALEHQERWITLADLAAILVELRLVDPDAADKMQACHDPACSFVEVCPNGDFSRLIPQRCWLRICPNCAKAIAQRLRDRLTSTLEQVTEDGPFDWTLKHVVPTIKRSTDRGRDVQDVHAMTKALFKFGWGKRHKLAGASAFLEFGPLGGNMHSHMIVWGGYKRQQALSDEWRRLSLKHRPMWRPWVERERAKLGQLYIHYSHDLYRGEQNTKHKRWRRQLCEKKYSRAGMDRELLKRARRQGMGDFILDIRAITQERAIGEVVKYVTKLHKRDAKTGAYLTSAADLAAMHMALKGKRRAWSWGSFYGVDLVPDEEGEAHAAHECPKCGARLLGLPVADAAALLHLKDVNNCQALPSSQAWQASGARGPAPP